MVRELNPSEGEYRSSIPLKEWAQKHKDSKYVPQELLEAWGIEAKLWAEIFRALLFLAPDSGMRMSDFLTAIVTLSNPSREIDAILLRFARRC
jgi:hypothetical protein